MNLEEYLRLQDDGCPHCGGHSSRSSRTPYMSLTMTLSHVESSNWDIIACQSVTPIAASRTSETKSVRPDRKPLGLRVSLTGFLRHAAEEMERLATELRERDGYDASKEDAPNAVQDPAIQADWMVGMLREISRHAATVSSGKASVSEFAYHYSLEDSLPIPDSRVECERAESNEVPDERNDAGAPKSHTSH